MHAKSISLFSSVPPSPFVSLHRHRLLMLVYLHQPRILILVELLNHRQLRGLLQLSHFWSPIPLALLCYRRSPGPPVSLQHRWLLSPLVSHSHYRAPDYQSFHLDPNGSSKFCPIPCHVSAPLLFRLGDCFI